MRISYLFDPLCGWCYGAGPALEALARLDGVTLELAPTGLFAGEGARPMDAQFAAYAWQNDQRVAQLTGQIFSAAYRNRILAARGEKFDSEPATLGLAAVGLSEPDRELDALTVLQRARYVDGQNNADRAVVAGILAQAGFSDAAARVRSADEELSAAYHRRVAAARSDMARFGARGVPALLVGNGASRRLLPSSVLFGAFGALTAQLQAA
jgi:putative protein-disulfide isomerase